MVVITREAVINTKRMLLGSWRSTASISFENLAGERKNMQNILNFRTARTNAERKPIHGKREILPIEDPAEGNGVEERHRRGHDVAQHR